MDGAVSFQKLTEQFRKMPGIGAKTAMRLAFYVLGLPKEEVDELADTIREAGEKIHRCPVCCNLTDEELCPVCKNTQRRQGLICVVENVESLMAIENTREYNGVYHVLHGVISPLDEVGPEDITVKELNRMLVKEGVQYYLGGRYLLNDRYQQSGFAQERSFHYYGLDGEKKERLYLVWTPEGTEFIKEMYFRQ